MTRGEQFAGVTVAIVTPFKNGEVDYDGLKDLVDWHLSRGTHGLAPCGTTGESPTLTHEENEKVIGLVVERAGGRMKVMAGTGSNSTAEAISLTRYAKKAGADGALVVGPYYNKPTQEGYFRHYAAIAEAVDLPIVVYNIPGRTGSNIEPETLIRLAREVPQVAAVKEATGSMDQASRVIGETDLTVLSGDDSLTLPLMALGGRGVVSVVGNVVPAEMVALFKAAEAGDFAEARGRHAKLFPLCREMLGAATNPIPVKAALRLLGRGTGDLRLPLCPIGVEGEARVRRALEGFGLPIA